MRIHKTKYNKIVKMLEQGYSYRQIAKEVRVSISQIAEVAKIYDLYIETNEIKKKIEKIKKDKEEELKNLQNLIKNIESLKLEIHRLEKRKQMLEDNIKVLKDEWLKTKLEINKILTDINFGILEARFKIPIGLPLEVYNSINKKLNELREIVANLRNKLHEAKK